MPRSWMTCHGYVLDDASGIYKPLERGPDGKVTGWAAEAIALYRARKADRIIAEINNGGEMVEATIRVIDQNIPYTGVHASRGKVTRAEPVSALYEQGKVHHVGSFALLEDQLCAFTSDFDRKTAGYSPDRLDALVWALTELMVEEIDGAGWLALAGDRTAAAAAANKKPAMILLSAPGGVSRVTTITGRQVSINNDGNVEVTEEEAKPLIGGGFKRI
jgi:hypothetical protein